VEEAINARMAKPKASLDYTELIFSRMTVGPYGTSDDFVQRLKFKARELRVARRTQSTPQQPRNEAQRRS
jgi:hypothetical protein